MVLLASFQAEMVLKLRSLGDCVNKFEAFSGRIIDCHEGLG